MGKAEFGTPKWISNNIKSKGLQKLRWYCQMCAKQCRDENGFKCHTTSESHQRQLLLFAEKPGRFLDSYSADFESAFVRHLRRCHGTKRVFANQVYQEYIKDKEHTHMNATKWVTLTAFVQYLGRSGKCTVDETEKGWYITWIDRDPETIARQEATDKKDKLAKDDDEKMAEFIARQVERERLRKGGDGGDDKPEYTDLVRGADHAKIQLGLKIEKAAVPSTSTARGVFKVPKRGRDGEGAETSAKKEKKTTKKASALEEIMRAEEEAKKKKKVEEEKKMEPAARPWLAEGIVVKVVAKSLGDRYYKKKGRVRDVDADDKYTAVVVMNDSGARIRVDQSHLETVIPAVGRPVRILAGRNRGERADLVGLDVDNFCATLALASGPDKGKAVRMAYEDFSKIHDG